MKALRGHLVHFQGDPQVQGQSAVQSITDGALLIDDEGRIAQIGEASIIPSDVECEHFERHFIMPGFIDTHIHFPQTQVVGSFGTQLLEWLQKYTFVEEQRYGDMAFCNEQADFFLEELIRNGTTTAAAYGSVHSQSIDALMSAAQRRHMCLIAGKSIMDRNAPTGLLDPAGGGIEQSRELIERWHKLDRLHYAITCRFAITSSHEQMLAIGELIQAYPDCFVQTHLSENHAEISTIRELFPDRLDYTDVYDHYGLLGPKSLLGHCIHLNDRELERLSATGSIACFCPTSNLFIGSGLFALPRLQQAGIAVTLATDIGGGTSYSMLQTAAEAYKVLQLQDHNWSALSAFHTMTRGNAMALGLADEIGTLQPGCMADLTVIDHCATPALAHRMARLEQGTLDEQLFALMIMGDDRHVAATYIAGQRLK